MVVLRSSAKSAFCRNADRMLEVEAELSRRVFGHSTHPNHVARFELAGAERAVFQA